ncbi:MAG: hypothetical protein QGF74_02985 [Candidatus Nanoarchaeia archaeon]|jgi:hypothetical protein|nr:hypothetical protein [Candidatus Nanoarchaeia archaeon]|tara:strand:- start:32309 stop:32773 length:465 start_codon:yes stop_codon:yes gene_type:complete
MKIIPANKKYIKEISKLMLKELENPNDKFPVDLISKFREHAKEDSISMELDNPNLISFLAINNHELIGFIVGYKEESNNTMIHHIAGDKIETKKLLLNRFIDECKKININNINADTFEFMENNELFKEEGFILTKKEKITDDLEMLWYEFNLKI